MVPASRRVRSHPPIYRERVLPSRTADVRPCTGPAVAVAAVAATAVGCALLVLRPALPGLPGDPTLVLLALFGLVFVVSVTWPFTDEDQAGRSTWVGVVALGVMAFAVARLVGGGHPPQPAVVRLIALNLVAAVAEEAFFRRLVYGALAPFGAPLAIGGSALLFAVVHLSTYGAWVLPIDLAAGLLFAWQRRATGSWTGPALTHAVANVLVVL